MALQLTADTEREQNDALKAKIEEMTATAQANAALVKEMEAKIKVKDAEMAEMQIKHINGKDVSSKSLKVGMGASQWAEPDALLEDSYVNVAGAAEGEDLGSNIEGTVRRPFLSTCSTGSP